MSRSLWLLSFTDLAALLLAFFALVVATSRFEPAPAKGTVPVGPHPVAGVPARGAGSAHAAERALAYRFGLVRQGLAALSGACGPREVVLRDSVLKATWDRAAPLHRPECVRELRRVLVPLSDAPSLAASLIRSAGGAGPREVSWGELVRMAHALSPPLPAPPRILVREAHGPETTLLFEPGAAR